MHVARRTHGFCTGLLLASLTAVVGCGGADDPGGADAAADGFLAFDIPRTDVVEADVPAVMDSQVARDAVIEDRAAPGDVRDVRVVLDVLQVDDAGVNPPQDGGMGGNCGPTPAVGEHITEMSTAGWAALNRGSAIMMHGCAGATRPQDCLASAPLVGTTTFGANWQPEALTGTHLRLLYTANYSSSFWSRSSADGRFVALGARIVDLAGPRMIPTAAQYDPGFFPDNSGFFYHSSMGPRVCEQSVLSTGMPAMITLTEPQCARASSVGLYQHMGAALSGGDYYVVYGRYTSDNGGHSPTLRDPAAAFGSGERQQVTVMTNTGSGFAIAGTGAVTTPGEADPIISPSGRLILTRTAGTGGGSHFVLRRLQVTRAGSAVSITAPTIGRYCFSGGKGSISYDERWFTYHHYVTAADAVEMGFTGPDDPAFAAYRTRGAANTYLVDLRTGARTRITNMQPGQYALFPHFRSDGWIYIIVRTAGSTPEHIVGSDAALTLP